MKDYRMCSHDTLDRIPGESEGYCADCGVEIDVAMRFVLVSKEKKDLMKKAWYARREPILQA